MNVDAITITQGGYEVKNLSYKKVGNIITGKVKDPVVGTPDKNDGWVTCVWRNNGTPRPDYGGSNRLDLKLVIPV